MGGDRNSLHVDCWGEVNWADGFDVSLSPTPVTHADNHLYFVNLGGYRAGEFTEQHRNLLIVAPTAESAKAKALSEVADWSQPHKDKLFDIEKLFDLSESLKRAGYFLKLDPAPQAKPFNFISCYLPISRPSKGQG